MPEINHNLQEFDTECAVTTSFELKLIAGKGSHLDKQENILPIITTNFIDFKEERFPTLLKLLRVTAWVMRSTNKFMRRNTENGTLTAQEIQKAK